MPSMGFSERQKKIFEILQGLDDKIAEAFKGGIEAFEGTSSDKVALSAHSLREVIYMLSRLDDIKKFGRVRKTSEGKTRKHDLIQNLDPVKGAPEDAYVLYDDLNDKSHWFAIVAHHSEFPTEKKFRKKLDEFEILLEKVFKPHFEVIYEIDILLTIQNPKKEDFDNLKQLLSRNSSAYNHFFQNATAKWLQFLLKDNYLKNPSHMIEVDGVKKFSNWPPAIYLWKSASEKPNEVSQIILNFNIPKKEDERNPWLLEYFVKAIIEMPPKYGKIFASKIYKEKWIQSSYHNYLHQPISELMKKLAKAGFKKETILLAKLLLNVKLGDPYVTGGIFEDYKKVRDVKPIIDSFWYGELLTKEIPIVFKKFPKAITELFVELVTNMIYLENIGRGDKKSKSDASIGWRPAIEDHEQNSERDFRSDLLGKLGNLLIDLGKKSIPLLKQVLKKISKINYPAFRRLELYVYRIYSEHFKKEIDVAIVNYFANYELHHEYFNLLENTFAQASKKSRKKYFSYIKNGPDKKNIAFWKRQSENQESGFMDLKIKLWKSSKLKPILNHLTNDEKENFSDLISNERGFPHPDFHTYSSGVKISQPISELKDNMTHEEVLNFIKNYKAKEQHDFGFHDGTPEKFQDYVQNDSKNYSKLALKFSDLDSTFIYKFLRGIEEAVKQKKTVFWEPILSLCEKIIDATKKGDHTKQKEFSILNSIASVLEDGIGFDSIDFVFRNRVWKLLNDLITLQDIDPSWEETYPREDMDAYGISINTLDGKTFHAIMKYVIWCEVHLKKKHIFVPEAKKLLSSYFEQKFPATISRQAVMGYYLSTLYYYDKSWIRSQLSSLFKNQSESLSRAAWDGYLVGRVYGDVFSDLLDQYNTHIKKLNSPPLKDDRLWDYDERVINHITLAYLFKYKNAEKLFTYLLNHSHEKVLSHCTWHIGRILKKQKNKPDKSFDVQAFKKLWKNSILTSNEELRTWVEYTPFNKDETLQLLYNSLKKSTKSIRFLSFLVKEIEPYAKTHPQSTFKCLDVLIRKLADNPEFHIARDNLKSLLKILLKNNKTTKKTIILIHYLGELGYNEFKDLLDNDK